MKFIDLFCGIGGFRIAFEQACHEKDIFPACVFSSDIDPDVQKTYKENFGELPAGDITKIDESGIPCHDILFAGFPCQSFSICGQMKGFEDIRGTLFFDIARILKEKRPNAFVLENVKMLKNHNNGKTLAKIIETLTDLGYHVKYKILNALDFGLPQKRERIFIVGTKENVKFEFPHRDVAMRPLSDILEKEVAQRYYASETIRKKRAKCFKGSISREPLIWHENKSGNISAYPYSCAMRAAASHNYLLVNGERRLTEREMLRLQGFPDNFKIVGSYSILRKQTGNSLPIPCAKDIIDELLTSQ